MPDHDSSSTQGHFRRPCAPGARCHNWRECPACAATRQRRIADAAERLAGQLGPLDWHTLTPSTQTPAAIAAERARWLRHAAPPGAIWTIERGAESGKLHINIIAPSGHAATTQTAAQFVVRSIESPRAVAAYISKREQAPSSRDYPGRTMGTAGPLWQWLTGKGQFPVLQAAAVQADIDRAVGAHPAPPAAQPIKCAADLDRTDYRAIMARRLPDLVSLRAALRTAAMLDAATGQPA